MNNWESVAAGFHRRVRENCWDSLAGELIQLHAPQVDDGRPVCRGCDRDPGSRSEAAWPCRTYAIIAAGTLNISDVEGTLTQLLHRAERRLSRA